MPMLQYSVETFGQFISEASELLIKNWKEISAYPDIILKPDFDRYIQIEQQGKLLVTTVRKDGFLIGYCLMFKDVHIHYRDILMATNDVIYLDPRYRKGKIGIKLIKFTEEQLKNFHLVVWHSKNRHPALGKVLEHLGYSSVETTYMKRIGE